MPKRTLQEILDEIYFKMSQSALSPLLTSSSKMAKWRLWIYLFADAIWKHEEICNYNAENTRSQNLPNTIDWILDFHDGLPLVWNNGQFTYDLTNVPDAAERKIIAQCAVLESNDGTLVVKVARKVGESFEPLLIDQLERLKAYSKDKKVPGVELQFINKVADQLKAKLKVYVDPQMIDIVTGRQLNVSGTVYPVKDAVNDYLTKLEFNGAFVTHFFTSAIVDKEGINLATIELIQWAYDSISWTNLENFREAESGHYKLLDANLEIEYLPYVLVNN